jgi:hypothetical protein
MIKITDNLALLLNWFVANILFNLAQTKKFIDALIYLAPNNFAFVATPYLFCRFF